MLYKSLSGFFGINQISELGMIDISVTPYLYYITNMNQLFIGIVLFLLRIIKEKNILHV